MGWFHLTQLLEEPLVSVVAVVEPFFLGPGKTTPGAKAFDALRTSLQSSHPDLAFCASVAELAMHEGGRKPLMALVAGRTCDAPALFTELVSKGVSKPRAAFRHGTVTHHASPHHAR